MLRKLFSLRWWLGVKPKFACQEIPDLSITVIIPAYNEEKCIADTIRSIKQQTVPIDEIYVIDDFSSDRTGDVARLEGVKVMRTPSNQGTKSRALNFALARIRTDLVVTIDADTELAPDAIERGMRYFNRQDTFAVCGMVVPQKIRTIWERGRFIEYLYGVEIIKRAQNNCSMVMVSSGCFTIFNNHHLRQLGLFKEQSIAEDMDLTWMAHFAGKKVYCDVSAVCYPIDPPTLTVYYKQLRRWYSGFLQCVSIHKKNLLRHPNYGALYTFYMIESSIFPLIIIGTLIYNIALWKFMLVVLVLHETLVVVPALYRGWRLGKFWKSFVSVPSYYITRPVNLCAWYASLIQEWVLKRKLVVWHKGH